MLRDPGVFDVDDVPGDILHRREILQEFKTTLEADWERNRTTPIRFVGPSGVGKTATALYALKDMDQNDQSSQTAYVDAWNQHKSRRTLYVILSGLATETGTLHPESPVEKLLQGIRDAVGEWAVVVVDEADMLQEPQLLLQLHLVEGLRLVLITNDDDDLVGDLGPVQAQTLLGGRPMPFNPYTVDQLVDILRPRAREGVHGRVDTDVLETIAAESHGDARTAIKSLEAATRIADRRGETEFSHDLLADAMQLGRRFVRQKASSRLRPEEYIVKEAVRELGTAKMGEIYPRYAGHEDVDDPKSERTVRKWLRKMEHYNMVRIHGETSDRTYEFVEVPDELATVVRQRP